MAPYDVGGYGGASICGLLIGLGSEVGTGHLRVRQRPDRNQARHCTCTIDVPANLALAATDKHRYYLYRGNHPSNMKDSIALHSRDEEAYSVDALLLLPTLDMPALSSPKYAAGARPS